MLTKTKPNGTFNVIGASGKIVPWKDIPRELYGVICKLHDYEKTGLNPETVINLRDQNAELIRKNNDLTAENARLKALVDNIESILNVKEY